MTITVGDVVRAMDAVIPEAWADDWDRVGLLAGDSAAEVRRAFVSLDPTEGAVERAREAGANVLVTHHPVYLTPGAPVSGVPGAHAALMSALSSGIALVAAHTNLDRSPAGAEALPLLLGLRPVRPVETSAQPVARVTVFCPPDAADAVAAAMTGAGAGRVGLYADCAFASAGEGRFRGLDGSAPATGEAGALERADEVRVETVCPPRAAEAVCAAARAVHPYEEPLIVVDEAKVSRGAVRLGRVCDPPPGSTVDSVARLVARKLGVMPRVWGDGDRSVSAVACGNGSASSLVAAAAASGADVLVCGEVRYQFALDALAAGMAVVEAGHDATEWPLVPVLADIVRTTPGMDAAVVIADSPRVGWRVVGPEA